MIFNFFLSYILIKASNKLGSPPPKRKRCELNQLSFNETTFTLILSYITLGVLSKLEAKWWFERSECDVSNKVCKFMICFFFLTTLCMKLLTKYGKLRSKRPQREMKSFPWEVWPEFSTY